MVPLSYRTEGRSARSNSSSPPPRGPPGANNASDFAYPHHLSLPVDSGRDLDDEVVFPTTPHYAWTEQMNGRGRALQLNIESAGLVQLSLERTDSEHEGDNSDAEEGGDED